MLAPASFGPAAHAQSGDRAQLMNRVIDGLNSPDPVTRMLTLEQAMAANDRNVQRIAIAAAFASSDLALRAAAIEAAFSTKSTFIVEFTGLAAGTKDRELWDKSGGRIEVWFDSFDRATGNFLGRSDVSYWNNSTKEWLKYDGNLSGDRLSFLVSVYKIGGINATCKGTVTAGDSASVMTGAMSCKLGTSNYVYTIKVDLLR